MIRLDAIVLPLVYLKVSSPADFLPLPTPNELIIAISEWMPGSGLPGCICYETKKKKQIMQTKETRRHAGGIPKPNDKKKVKRNFSHIL